MQISNNLRIDFSSLFNKQLQNAPRDIKIAFRHTLELFLEDPKNPQLRIHSLKKNYAGYLSFDVTDDWRVIFAIRKGKHTRVIIFHAIGTHKELYR